MRIFRLCLPTLLLLLLISPSTSFAQRGKGGRQKGTAGSRPPVATINGQPIPFDAYRDAVDDHMRFQRDAGTAVGVDDLIADTIMLDLIDDELVRQEAERRGFGVDRAEANRLLLKDPPEFMRAPFIDSRGTFRREVFEMVVRDPSQMVRLIDKSVERDSLVRQWKADLEKVVSFVQARENRRRLGDALAAEKPLTDRDIRHRYFAEKTQVIGSFVRVLHSSVPDSEVPISDAEARAWYEKNKEDYWAAPSRLVGVVVLPIDPSPADSAAHLRRVDSIRTAIITAPAGARSKVVADLQRMLPADRFSSEPIRPSQLSSDMLKQLARTGPGDLVGPFAQPGESTMLFVERRVPVADTVLRARHLLLRATPGDETADSAARELIAILRDSIDNEQEFLEGVNYFSTDASRADGGDLGYFGRGRMVHAFDSAAFAGPVGSVIGPVKSEHGYHLIWVNERVTEGFVVREIRVPFPVSTESRTAVARDAEALATAMRSGVGVDSLINTYRQRYPMMASDTTYIKRLERYGDVLAPARFAFDAKVGDVTVIPLPLNRIMVIRLNAIWAGGTPEYEKIPIYPTAHARRARQLDILEPRMKEIASKITPDMLIGPLRELAPMAEVFLLNERTVTAPPDEEETILDSLVAAVPRNAVGGPVRGRHGFYFLRVLEKNGPTESDFERERAEFAETYRQRRRSQLLVAKIADLRARATFVDHRAAAR